MSRYVYSPTVNTLDGIMQQINPLMGANSDAGMGPEGWQPMYQSWALSGMAETGNEGWGGMYQSWALAGAAQDATRGSEGWQPMYQSWALAGIDDTLSPMIRSDIATPTVDIKDASSQFSMPALNGGLGAVADALSVLSVVDLLSR